MDSQLTVGGLTPGQIAARWRTRGRDRAGLRERARTHRVSVATAKLYAAALGLALAWIEIDDEHPPAPRLITPRDVVRRAIRLARRAVVEDGRPRELPLGDATAACAAGAQSDDRPSPAVVARVEAVRALAQSPGQRALVRAILEDGCTTLSDVDRLYGWTDGQARVQAARIRRKMAG